MKEFEGSVELHLPGGGGFSTLFHTISICENKQKVFQDFTNTSFSKLPYIKILRRQKLWQIGTQNMFGRENIGKLGLYTEGNQGKTKDSQIKHQQISKFAKDLYCPSFMPYGIQI